MAYAKQACQIDRNGSLGRRHDTPACRVVSGSDSVNLELIHDVPQAPEKQS
jgi:hypothetical protein